jgi:hypothetical protein
MFLASVCILLPLYLGAFSARTALRFGIYFGVAWSLDSAVANYMGIRTAENLSCGTFLGANTMFLAALPCSIFFFWLLGRSFYERAIEHKRRYSSRADIEQHEILPIEPWNWRWVDPSAPWRGAWVGLLVGPLVLPIAWFFGKTTQGLVAVPMISLLVCMFSGLSGSGTAKVSIEPNQGIARSLRHALRMVVWFVACGVLC